MIKGTTKSTPEEIQEMRRLYKEGINMSEIGRKFHRDHSSIFYWIHKDEDYVKNRGIRKKDKQESNEEEKEKKAIQTVDPNLCLMCKKRKENPKWILTNFCSKMCWTKHHFPLGFKGDYTWQT